MKEAERIIYEQFNCILYNASPEDKDFLIELRRLLDETIVNLDMK